QTRFLFLLLGHVASNAIDEPLLGRGNDRPENPVIRSLNGTVAIGEVHQVLARRRYSKGRRARGLHIIGMEKANVWPGKQLFLRIAELLFPRTVDPLQIAVEAGDAKQVNGKIEEVLKFLEVRERISIGPLSHHDGLLVIWPEE